MFSISNISSVKFALINLLDCFILPWGFVFEQKEHLFLGENKKLEGSHAFFSSQFSFSKIIGLKNGNCLNCHDEQFYSSSMFLVWVDIRLGTFVENLKKSTVLFSFSFEKLLWHLWILSIDLKTL